MDDPILSRKQRGAASLICKQSGCQRPARKLGYCTGHYQRLRFGLPLDKPFIKKERSGIIFHISDLHNHALERNGLCLSKLYVTSTSKYTWKCVNGHIWSAKWSNVNSLGSWCPICASGAGERICRSALQSIFNVEFPKKRPEWLLSDSGRRLELDGYNEAIGIAFEYQGSQHYEARASDPRMTNDHLIITRRHDNVKRKLCWSRNIYLVLIPQIKDLTNSELIMNQIEVYILYSGAKLPITWKRKRSLVMESVTSAIYEEHSSCKVPDCIWLAKKAGYCASHYQQVRRLGYVCAEPIRRRNRSRRT